MNKNEMVANEYGITNNFPVFYNQAFVCYIFCKDDSKNNIPAISTESFISQLFLFLKVRQSALKIGIKAEFCIYGFFLKIVFV